MKKLIYISICLYMILGISCKKEDKKMDKEMVIEVTKLIVSPDKLSLTPNDKYRLEYTLQPEGAIDDDVLWESLDEKIISVDEFGVINALAVGKTTVKATSSNGMIGKCEVTVALEIIHVTGLSLNAETLNLDINEQFVLTAKVLPNTASDKSLTWSTSTDVISISETGLVTAIKEGVAKVTASTTDGGFKASCNVIVKKKQDPNTFTDIRDNKVYKTVIIGGQTWMAENLAYLPSISTSETSETEAHYYVYDNESINVDEVKQSDNYIQYGALYNWNAAKEACPEGWHVPTSEEWKELEKFLGMSQADADKTGERGNIANKLKSTTGWASGDSGSNESGFSALPAGFKGSIYSHIGKRAMFWTGTEYESSKRGAYYRKIDEFESYVYSRYANKKDAHSVRLVKDKEEDTSFTDARDGHKYNTVKIGNQTWMAENLAYLPEISEPTGKNGETSKYFVLGYTGTDLAEAKALENYSKYGVLYNFAAAQESCPEGWHLPSKDELKELVDYVSKDGASSGKVLKSTDSWDEDGNGTDDYGFKMLGGGYYNYSNYMFLYERQLSCLWSSSPKEPNIYTLSFAYVNQVANIQAFSNMCGYYIRCVKN